MRHIHSELEKITLGHSAPSIWNKQQTTVKFEEIFPLKGTVGNSQVSEGGGMVRSQGVEVATVEEFKILWVSCPKSWRVW